MKLKSFQNKILYLSVGLLVCAIVSTQSLAQESATKSTYEVVLRSDVKFQPLNPARGNKGPQAGILWGDIKKNVPTGAIIKFTGGFSSPPHIHNITYRAVVISGAVHNDDPQAKAMWMGPSSFWTQPAGEPHITTAAKGKNATVFLEILGGPYLVKPSKEASDNGERPINIDRSNIVWLGAADISWLAQSDKSDSRIGPKMAFLWGSLGEGKLRGSLVKLPSGFSGELRSKSSDLRAVVIQGTPRHQVSDGRDAKILEPGSYFGSKGTIVHQISCQSNQDCVFYVRSNGKFAVSEM